MTTCSCGSTTTANTNAYIELERLLLELGWAAPDEIKTSCTQCLDSMINDVKGELTAIQQRSVHKTDSLFKVLSTEHPDYKMCVERFNETVNAEVLRIEQICNSDLEQEFMENSKGGGELKWLFHGSQNQNYVSIATNGFDKKRSKDGLLGKGVYFAQDATYSTAFTHRIVEQGKDEPVANMFLCKVYLLPSDVKGTNIYCIHSDRRAYPKYLIYYGSRYYS